MINSGRRQAIPAFPAMKKIRIQHYKPQKCGFFALPDTIELILLRIFSDRTGTKIFSILKNVP